MVNSSTFNASGETGTITYTVFLQVDGEILLDEQDVVEPFSTPTVVTGGTTFGSLPTSGAIVDYGAVDFGIEDYEWDHEKYSETNVYDATGTYTAANTTGYSTQELAATASSWDTTRTVNNSAATATYTTIRGNAWSYDLTTTDQSSGELLHRLGQYRDSPDTQPGKTAPMTTPASNWGVWNINQQGQGSYGGSDKGNLSYDAELTQTGSVITGTNSNGQLSLSKTMADVYQRTDGTLTGGGTYSMAVIDPAQTYNDTTTETQVYGSPSAAGDTLKFSGSDSDGVGTAMSNSDSYTDTTPKGPLTTSDLASSSKGTASKHTYSGTLNVATGVSTVHSTNSVATSGTTILLSSGTYSYTDGSQSLTMVSLFGTSGDTFNRSQVDGTLNANGIQVGGTSYSYADDSGVMQGGASSRYQQTNSPTCTSLQVFVGNYGDDLTSDLEANPDGSSTGDVGSHSDSQVVTDTTTGLNGPQTIKGGTATYTSKNHNTDVYKTAARMPACPWTGTSSAASPGMRAMTTTTGTTTCREDRSHQRHAAQHNSGQR